MDFGKKALIRFGRKLFSALSVDIVREVVSQLQAEILAGTYLTPLSTRFFPGTTGALNPSILVAILNDIVIKRRKRIVECGGGVSTLYIARLLKEHGGHLFTLEEDSNWATFLASELKAEDLDQVVSMVCAPLTNSPFSLTGEPWYDEAKVRDAVAGDVDLLIVDGPSVGTIRYPAVPFFKAQLADDFTIVLDDMCRGGREFLPKWEADLNISFRVLGDYAIGATDPSIKVFVAPV